MLGITQQELIFQLLPNTLTIDGISYSIQKTLGEASVNEVVYPTVNLSFIGNNTPYYESVDRCSQLTTETTITESDIRAVILRYTCGALDKVVTTSVTYTFKAGQLTYDIKCPTVKINSIMSGQTTYASNTYQLNTTRDSITWITPPAVGTSFTINYDYICSGYFICNKIIEYIIQDLLGNSRVLLNNSSIQILDASRITDLSKVYSTQSLTVLSVDVNATYNFEWTRQLSEAVISIDTIHLDVEMEAGDTDIPVEEFEIITTN